jgi:hypothetical protein
MAHLPRLVPSFAYYITKLLIESLSFSSVLIWMTNFPLMLQSCVRLGPSRGADGRDELWMDVSG